MNLAEWTQTNKHTLRSLYVDFLTDMDYNETDLKNGTCPTYAEFQEQLYRETKHYTMKKN